METNPYEYDRTSQGTPQQNQLFQYRPAEAQNGQQSVQSHNQKLPTRWIKNLERERKCLKHEHSRWPMLSKELWLLLQS